VGYQQEEKDSTPNPPHTVEKTCKRETESVFRKDISPFLNSPFSGHLRKRQMGAPGHTQRLLKAALLEL